jgi:uncharacterized membrane protein YdfJ with MMPL/SSD domain
MATVFVPSLAALLGRWIWWPGHQGEPERGWLVSAVRADRGGEPDAPEVEERVGAAGR